MQQPEPFDPERAYADPIYFIERVMGITLDAWQKHFIARSRMMGAAVKCSEPRIEGLSLPAFCYLGEKL